MLVSQLQNPVTLDIDAVSDNAANANVSGTFYMYPEPNACLYYKLKQTRNACLVLHIDAEPDNTISLADAHNVSIFDYDSTTGLLILEITTVPFSGKICLRRSGIVYYTWTIVPEVQTLDGLFLSDDTTYGDNP